MRGSFPTKDIVVALRSRSNNLFIINTLTRQNKVAKNKILVSDPDFALDEAPGACALIRNPGTIYSTADYPEAFFG